MLVNREALKALVDWSVRYLRETAPRLKLTGERVKTIEQMRLEFAPLVVRLDAADMLVEMISETTPLENQ